LWKAPCLPPLETCEQAIRRFCQRYFKQHSEQIKKVLAELV
jgi:hypothetical protein